jgi:putative transposase
MRIVPIAIGMDNHIHIIWQVKGDIDTSEVQKQFLEGCSKNIKVDLELHHPNVLPFSSR